MSPAAVPTDTAGKKPASLMGDPTGVYEVCPVVTATWLENKS